MNKTKRGEEMEITIDLCLTDSEHLEEIVKILDKIIKEYNGTYTINFS